MKPCFKKISLNPQSSLAVAVQNGSNMVNQFHYHPELELVLVKNSSGKVLMGETYSDFTHDDIFLIGSNVPHVFSHDFTWSVSRRLTEEAVSIHFKESFLGAAFHQLPEVDEINALFALAKKGIKLQGKLKSEVMKRMEQMKVNSGMENLLLHLEILMLIARSSEYVTVSAQSCVYMETDSSNKRIEKVYQFTSGNYSREINIEEVAMLIGLTKESFCRFFKTITRKTYFQYLIEYRIGQACKMLRESDYSIKEIAYKCGYENLSNFHHQFKKVTSFSPVQYQENMYQSFEMAPATGYALGKKVA